MTVKMRQLFTSLFLVLGTMLALLAALLWLDLAVAGTKTSHAATGEAFPLAIADVGVAEPQPQALTAGVQLGTDDFGGFEDVYTTDTRVLATGSVTAFLQADGLDVNPQAVGSLLTVFWCGEPVLLEAAVEALGQIGDPRVVEPLIGNLQDMDERARQAAAEALHKIGWQPKQDGIEAILG